MFRKSDSLVAVGVELVVARHGDEAAIRRPQRVEDLSTRLVPHLSRKVEITLTVQGRIQDFLQGGSPTAMYSGRRADGFFFFFLAIYS